MPELAGLEVTSVLRRQMRAGAMDARRAGHVLGDLAALPARGAAPPAAVQVLGATRRPHPYDAVYVALAEAIPATLLTGDRRLATAPGDALLHRNLAAHALSASDAS